MTAITKFNKITMLEQAGLSFVWLSIVLPPPPDFLYVLKIEKMISALTLWNVTRTFLVDTLTSRA